MEYPFPGSCQQCRSSPLRLSDFSDKPHCLDCGFNLEQTVPETLAEIFAQKMNFSTYTSESAPPVHSPTSSTQDSCQDAKIVYSISQHYHHSTHLARAASDLSLTDTTPYSVFPERPSTTDTLIQGGISPTSLLRSQVSLFEQSNDEQQSRLLELWRFAPPNYTANGGQELADRIGEYQVMTLEQEEELALLRHKRNMQGKEDPNNDLDMDEFSGYDSPSIGEVTSTQILPLEEQAPLEIFSPANDYCHEGFELEQQDSAEYPGWYLGQQYVEHQYGMFEQMHR